MQMALLKLDDPRAVVDELMRRDFMAFLIRAFPHINGGADLDLNWHLDAIAHQLNRVVTRDCRRLLVALPPRNLKSIMVSVVWVAWCLGREPRLNFVCVSYSNELSAKHARDTRAIMQAPWYKRLFPRTILSRNRSAAHDFETTAGGGRLATSIGGTLTGRGGDIIIIDDPLKPDEANSDTSRTAVNEWFHATLASRLNDKKRGAIITVMQRLHQYDLAGMLQESGEWDELSLPAIADDDIAVPLTGGRSYLRKAGEALHPSREPVRELEKIKASVGSVIFAAQYQQQPVPAEGNLIKADWLQTYQGNPVSDVAGGQTVQSWDTASKDGLFNDYSVCVTAFVRGKDIYILDVLRRRLEFPDLKKEVIARARAFRAGVLLIEDAASGTQLLQTLLAEQPTGVPHPIAQKPEGDKKSRVAGVSTMIESGQLKLPTAATWLAEFKAEVLAFPSSRFDDQVDALSQLLAWVRRRDIAYDGPGGMGFTVYGDGFPDDEEIHPDLEYLYVR